MVWLVGMADVDQPTTRSSIGRAIAQFTVSPSHFSLARALSLSSLFLSSLSLSLSLSLYRSIYLLISIDLYLYLSIFYLSIPPLLRTPSNIANSQPHEHLSPDRRSEA